MLAEHCFRWLLQLLCNSVHLKFSPSWFFFSFLPHMYVCNVMFQMFSKSRLQVKVNFKGVQTSGISHPSFVLLIPETDHLQLINHNKGFIEGLEKVLQPVNCSLPTSFCTFWAWNTHEASAQLICPLPVWVAEVKGGRNFFYYCLWWKQSVDISITLSWRKT